MPRQQYLHGTKGGTALVSDSAGEQRGPISPNTDLQDERIATFCSASDPVCISYPPLGITQVLTPSSTDINSGQLQFYVQPQRGADYLLDQMGLYITFECLRSNSANETIAPDPSIFAMSPYAHMLFSTGQVEYAGIQLDSNPDIPVISSSIFPMLSAYGQSYNLSQAIIGEIPDEKYNLDNPADAGVDVHVPGVKPNPADPWNGHTSVTFDPSFVTARRNYLMGDSLISPSADGITDVALGPSPAWDANTLSAYIPLSVFWGFFQRQLGIPADNYMLIKLNRQPNDVGYFFSKFGAERDGLGNAPPYPNPIVRLKQARLVTTFGKLTEEAVSLYDSFRERIWSSPAYSRVNPSIRDSGSGTENIPGFQGMSGLIIRWGGNYLSHSAVSMLAMGQSIPLSNSWHFQLGYEGQVVPMTLLPTTLPILTYAGEITRLPAVGPPLVTPLNINAVKTAPNDCYVYYNMYKDSPSNLCHSLAGGYNLGVRDDVKTWATTQNTLVFDITPSECLNLDMNTTSFVITYNFNGVSGVAPGVGGHNRIAPNTFGMYIVVCRTNVYRYERDTGTIQLIHGSNT